MATGFFGDEPTFWHAGGNYAGTLQLGGLVQPLAAGALHDRGKGDGAGFNLNLPLAPGTGHVSYLHALDSIVIPQIKAYAPDLIIVACGYDCSAPCWRWRGHSGRLQRGSSRPRTISR